MNNKFDLNIFAQSWDVQVRHLWPSTYPAELSEELASYGVKTILDCAGGTGYPCIELKEMGWDITYSDGSKIIRDYFLSKTAKKQIQIPSYLSKWEELSLSLPQTFDALLCGGNSFLGIATYGDDNHILSIEENLAKMENALEEFYRVINPKGILFIDLPNEDSLKPSAPYRADEFIYNDTSVIMDISYDKLTNVRTTREVKREISTGKIIHSLEYQIHPISSDQLITLLLKVGFKKVIKSTTHTASYIDAFIATK